MKTIELTPPVFHTLTKTLVENETLCEMATRLFDVDFDSMKNGERTEIPLTFTDGSRSVIRFYRVTGKGGRKDKRYSIPAKDLRAQASVGDTITFSFVFDENGQPMLCANVTRQPEHASLTTDDLDVSELSA